MCAYCKIKFTLYIHTYYSSNFFSPKRQLVCNIPRKIFPFRYELTGKKKKKKEKTFLNI